MPVKQPAPGDAQDANSHPVLFADDFLSTAMQKLDFLMERGSRCVAIILQNRYGSQQKIDRWGKVVIVEEKPTAQDVTGVLDIPACLSQMIATLDKAVDQTPYEDEKDALIDAMEQLQVAAKVSDKIAQFEFQEDEPLAKGVPMDHNG
jgi:hypothetical protein